MAGGLAQPFPYTVNSCSRKKKMLQDLAISFSKTTVKDHYKIYELSFLLLVATFINSLDPSLDVCKVHENLLKIRKDGIIFFSV